jgi:L-serine/L-threonine ammonia-lyase
MAYLCQTLLESKGRGVNVKLISSSGGNAGLAVTTVASHLGMEVDVIVPETTKPFVVDKLTSLGAKVTVFGQNWNAADQLARELVEKDANAEYVSPYDNALLWTGHSSLMDELVEELPNKLQLGAIVASVGGGGLLCGILEGIARHSLHSTRVITSETEGAASFQKAWLQGKPIRLESIDSVATSLGALEVTPVSLERAKALTARGGSLVPQICTDAEAIDACLQFAAHHRMLVEPACGAALAVVYSERLRNSALDGVEGAVVVEVCGGSGVSIDLMQMWKEEFL